MRWLDSESGPCSLETGSSFEARSLFLIIEESPGILGQSQPGEANIVLMRKVNPGPRRLFLEPDGRPLELEGSIDTKGCNRRRRRPHPHRDTTRRLDHDLDAYHRAAT